MAVVFTRKCTDLYNIGGSKRQPEINLVTSDDLDTSNDERKELKAQVALYQEEIMKQQKEINTLKAERQVTPFVTWLASAFRQHLCSYIVAEPLSQVRTLELQQLELDLHDSRIYKDKPVEERWNDMCKYLEWSKDWDTDSEIPSVVTYIDENADERLLYNDVNCYDEYVKEGREMLKQLPEDHYAKELLALWNMLIIKLGHSN